MATRRRFRRLILPVLSSSNSWNARRISSIGSRARILSLTECALRDVRDGRIKRPRVVRDGERVGRDGTTY